MWIMDFVHKICQCRFIVFNRCITLMGDVSSWGDLLWVETRVYGKSLYIPLQQLPWEAWGLKTTLFFSRKVFQIISVTVLWSEDEIIQRRGSKYTLLILVRYKCFMILLCLNQFFFIINKEIVSTSHITFQLQRNSWVPKYDSTEGQLAR